MRIRGQRIGRLWGVLLVAAVGAAAWAVGCNHQQPQGVSQTPGRPLVRVRMVERALQVKLAATASPTVQLAGSAPQTMSFPRGVAVPVTLGPDGWHIGAVTLPPGELILQPESDGSVSVEGMAYRGNYHLVPTAATTYDVISHVEIDDYLKGVLPRELFADFEPEAYRAQAIVARTYALYCVRTASPGSSWDVHADTKSQVYGGMKVETAKSRSATDSTAGVVVAYGPPGQEKIFKAYFSACCGGASQSAFDAFHEAQFEPFSEQYVGTRCDTSVGIYHSKFNWGPIVISKAELTRRFRAWGRTYKRSERDIGNITRVEVLRANAAGRPVQFVATDDRGVSYYLGGEDLRTAVNTDAAPGTTLPSSYVTPVTDSTAVRFEHGHGNGHGVGMCQWCAQAQAKQGARHEAIVLGAFRGAKLVKAY